MKIIKGIAVFVFLVFLLGSCFDPPEFPMTPNISLNSLTFQRGEADTIFLTINFKDGDGNLGLRSFEVDSPYHELNFFLDNNGQVTSLATRYYTVGYPSVDVQAKVLIVPDDAEGKLVTKRMRQITGNTHFPNYVDPFTCSAYKIDSIYILEADRQRILDKKNYKIDKAFYDIQGDTGLVLIKDTLYYEPNPDYYNIDVVFMEKVSGNNYAEVQWDEEFCFNGRGSFPGFNGRFPVLSDSETPLEGILKYKITSAFLYDFFTVRPLKLKILIRDKALNVSNMIETDEFTLDQIRR